MERAVSDITIQAITVLEDRHCAKIRSERCSAKPEAILAEPRSSGTQKGSRDPRRQAPASPTDLQIRRRSPPKDSLGGLAWGPLRPGKHGILHVPNEPRECRKRIMYLRVGLS
jgi:hypothetical protein